MKGEKAINDFFAKLKAETQGKKPEKDQRTKNKRINEFFNKLKEEKENEGNNF